MLLIDAIGPFFRHYKPKRINWSKIPFAELETEQGLKPEVLESVPKDFEKFCRHAKEFGYTAITLDDVAHLCPVEDYPNYLNQKIDAYRTLFRNLFQIASALQLKIFITTDIAFYCNAMEKRLSTHPSEISHWLADRFEQLFNDFPEVAGVITRFGETDGIDVRGDFRSRLVLKKPRHIRTFLKTVLPVFEKRDRLLVFRTWSVGAYPIGDLMWNATTFNRVFDDIDSPSLIISMKYGESDFFRYLPTNPLFFMGKHRKLVEFQARREYEGFGAYPSFTGFDYETHLARLAKASNIVGASVWCQTGGWGKLRQLTFIRSSSPWVELNAFVIPKIFHGQTCDAAVEQYCQDRLPEVDAAKLIEFLRISDEAIEDLLYVREFAERRLFFRRLRLPPQVFVFWDRIIVDDNIRQILACLVQDPERALDEGRCGLLLIHRMMEMAETHGLPKKGLKYQLKTFELIAAAREYYFGSDSIESEQRLVQLKEAYKATVKRNYSLQLNFKRSRIRPVQARVALKTMLRQTDRYRWVDRLVTLRLLAWMYHVARVMGIGFGPRFAQKQAMGIETLFK